MRLRLMTVGVGEPWESALVQACQDRSVPAVVVQRCYDLADLLASAAAGKAEVVVVAADVRWLDRDTLAKAGAAGLAVVGMVPAGGEEAERRLLQLGVDYVVPADTPTAVLVDLAKAVVTARRRHRSEPGGESRARDLGRPNQGGELRSRPRPAGSAQRMDLAGTSRTDLPGAGGPMTPEATRDNAAPSSPSSPSSARSRVSDWPAHTQSPGEPAQGQEREHSLVVVWGPKGAPGRTTIAVNLAFESLPLASETLLVDADTYGGSVVQTLGFLDDCPGLAWAARLASRGELDVPKLWQATRAASPNGLRVLAGLPRAELWTEVRPATWESLLELFRVSFPLTVIDVGFCLEEDEELLYDHVRFRRNAVARLALQRADTVVAVTRADPVGLHDFVHAFQQLRDLGVSPSRVRVVVNQVRGGLFGGDATGQIRASLSRYVGLEPSAFVPYDRANLDAALMAGRALRENRPGAPAQQALAALALSVFGTPPVAEQRRRLLRRRVPRRPAVLWDGNPDGPTVTKRAGW
jgi:MinD-like ATPase involved in chromosome partitioning or flagellar assembly